MSFETALVVMVISGVGIASVAVLMLSWLLYDGVRGVYRALTCDEEGGEDEPKRQGT